MFEDHSAGWGEGDPDRKSGVHKATGAQGPCGRERAGGGGAEAQLCCFTAGWLGPSLAVPAGGGYRLPSPLYGMWGRGGQIGFSCSL